jgi:hypothetical protein
MCASSWVEEKQGSRVSLSAEQIRKNKHTSKKEGQSRKLKNTQIRRRHRPADQKKLHEGTR